MTTTCITCERPVPGQEYGCPACARAAERALTAIAGLAADARDVVARQVRRGPAIGRSGAGSRPPLDLGAAERLAEVTNAITTWVRHVAEERGANGPESHGDGRTGMGESDGLAVASRWLCEHLEWLRHRPEWSEAHGDITAAERTLRAIVDGPGERELVGACPCGTTLYARPGRAVVTCPDCGAEWGTAESRQILIRHVEGMLLTAAEIAGLAVVQDPDRDRQRVRKLINVWTNRGQLTPAGITADGDPTYQVGPVLARLADVRPRAREAVA